MPEHFARRRIENVHGLAGRGADELAIDVKLRVVGHRHHGHGFRASAGKGAAPVSSSISSRRRFLGSTPKVRTTRISTTSRPIIYTSTPPTPCALNSATTMNDVKIIAPRPNVLQ